MILSVVKGHALGVLAAFYLTLDLVDHYVNVAYLITELLIEGLDELTHGFD